MENWEVIPLFSDYSVSDHGNVRHDKSGRILAISKNQYGVTQVGMMRDGIQRHRSVALLVAKAFLPEIKRFRKSKKAFDTPINLDGDRYNNHIDNLMWRPRWFAIKYNRQFRYPSEFSIDLPIVDLKTGEISENSFACATRYGLLEKEVFFAVYNRTYVWPTYQQFGIFEE